MINDQLIEDLMVQRINSSRKINLRDEHEINVVVHELIRYINDINSISRFDDTFHQYNMDKIEILPELSAFITPKSVCWDPTDLKCPDYILRGPTVEWGIDVDKDIAERYSQYMSYGFDVNVLNNLQSRLRSFFKKDANDLVPISTLKVDVPLSSVIHIVVPEGYENCHYYDEPYIPYVVKKEVGANYSNPYYNESYNKVIQDFFNRFKF